MSRKTEKDLEAKYVAFRALIQRIVQNADETMCSDPCPEYLAILKLPEQERQDMLGEAR